MLTGYAICKMTGRDRHEQVQRAKYLVAKAAQYGIRLIHPVLIEGVEDRQGPLVNTDTQHLGGLWANDKRICRFEAHFAVWDGADMKTYGGEREYGLVRWCIWKPVILIMPNTELTVVRFEDDFVAPNADVAFAYARKMFGTRWKRWMWRIPMLCRTLPQWLLTQLYAWR